MDFKIISICFLIINLMSMIVTVADKRKAQKGSRRISEKSLFLLALLGGSAFIYITMRIIRHKTKHKRFMIGLPVMMLVQGILILVLYCLQ